MPRDDEHSLIWVARRATEAAVRGETWRPVRLEPPFDRARPVFVTLRKPDGGLRGCIGHLRAVKGNLAEEVASCAVAAALRDRRFQPVAVTELDGLSYEISILEDAEPVDDIATLDPKRWGVIVTAGNRRGVLLPDIDGVDTVADQLSITRRKGRIQPDEPQTIERFEVTKVV